MFRIENCEVIRQTKKAILVESDEFLNLTGEVQQWIPISMIHDNSEVWKYKQKGTLIIEEWFAEKKEWI